ncbi:NAD(P)H-quinone oxidoreductase subunit U, chloroplastic [Mangifera indica]|uniref:NAD(P)H-quinone oxidoreductase subunit U, chloroplastic n=1 Tax=Mangifera indica TaxID=29780 RepID=UPI001CF9DACF|nr:NAD(P)H-quinone oxidoreductase subunit U, chloroplastic [Mangifera indica]
MAISSTTATPYISLKHFHVLSINKAPFFSYSLPFATSKPRKLVVRNAGSDVSAETSSTDIEPETSIEAPTEPSSLINSLNVERALRGIAITDVDHYATLGLRRGCSYEQVTSAYKNKVEELKSQELEEEEEEEVAKKMEQLKESYSILSSVEERRLYDWSLARNEKPDKYVWPFEVDITQAPKGTPPPPKPEDVGPTRAVGYFFLGWLILSFVLSIAYNL